MWFCYYKVICYALKLLYWSKTRNKIPQLKINWWIDYEYKLLLTYSVCRENQVITPIVHERYTAYS